MSEDWLTMAVQNNMDWYEGQARSWGLPCTRTADTWWTPHPVRPYYSNLVCCGPQPDALIRKLDTALHTQWTIKDAHRTYDLEPLGFTTLFDAYWFGRATGISAGKLQADTRNVHQVKSLEEFSIWVDAWGETPQDEAVFEPEFLQQPALKMLYVKKGSKLAGGLCINFSGPAIGISNTFGSLAALDQCLAWVVEVYPDKVVVGYDRKDEIQRLQAYGFENLGELRIWIRTV